MQTTQERAGCLSRTGCRFWLVGLPLGLLAVVALLALGVVLWQDRVRDSGFYLSDASPSLGLTQRLYLQSYLADRVDELAAAAGTAVTPITFEIQPGQTADAVAAGLRDAGLLTERELFINYLRFYGLDTQLAVGQYYLEPPLTIPQLADALSHDYARVAEVSFLPGLRIEELSAALAQLQPANIDADEFLAIAQRRAPFDTSRYDFLAALPPDATLEGFLAPGAYQLPPYADAAFLVDAMLQRFGEQVTPAMRQAYGAQGLSLRDAVILASIVAREALVEDERPFIASVYYNRVVAGMPLQADPTVQYAAGYHSDTGSWWKVPLSRADLELNHPYNTYVIPGLPPGPISNPGVSSLQAVAAPADTNYYFFVLDCLANNGRHRFSTTFDEHLANVQFCR